MQLSRLLKTDAQVKSTAGVCEVPDAESTLVGTTQQGGGAACAVRLIGKGSIAIAHASVLMVAPRQTRHWTDVMRKVVYIGTPPETFAPWGREGAHASVSDFV